MAMQDGHLNLNANSTRRELLGAALMVSPVILTSCRAPAPPASSRPAARTFEIVDDGRPSSLLVNGLASLRDLSGPEYRLTFQQLAEFQDTFLATQPHEPNYPWPRDALHWWSRIWEYPYVWINLKSLLGRHRKDRTPILDFGSGVTAFPFFVAKQLDADVICMDIDANIAGSITRTANKLGVAEHISFIQNSEHSIPLKAHAIGSLYCISVLEHIQEPDSIIAEFHRVLKPGGILLLTMDVAGRPNSALGLDAANYHKVYESLRRYFIPLYERRLVHPTEVLTSESSPLPMEPPTPTPQRSNEGILARLHNTLSGGAKPAQPERLLLFCEGFLGRKRA